MCVSPSLSIVILARNIAITPSHLATSLQTCTVAVLALIGFAVVGMVSDDVAATWLKYKGLFPKWRKLTLILKGGLELDVYVATRQDF